MTLYMTLLMISALLDQNEKGPWSANAWKARHQRLLQKLEKCELELDKFAMQIDNTFQLFLCGEIARTVMYCRVLVLLRMQWLWQS